MLSPEAPIAFTTGNPMCPTISSLGFRPNSRACLRKAIVHGGGNASTSTMSGFFCLMARMMDEKSLVLFGASSWYTTDLPCLVK